MERSTNGTASFAVPIDLGRSDRSEPVDFIWAYVGPTNLNFNWDSRGKARVKVVVPSEATRSSLEMALIGEAAQGNDVADTVEEALCEAIGAQRRVFGKDDIRLAAGEVDVPRDRKAIIDLLILSSRNQCL